MLLNEATRVQDMLVEKLRELNLESVLRQDKSQCLDMGDSVFLEVVLSDGAELERVETMVAELKEALGARGTRVDSIVRAIWEVVDVQSHGAAYGKDGAPRAAEEFYVSLRSGARMHTAVAETTWGTMDAVRRRPDRQVATGKAEEKRVREELVAMIRKFVEYELRQGGLGYWDPVKHPRRELNEAAILFLSGQRN